MTVDRYSKFILTLIAIGILGLNFHLFQGSFIKDAYAFNEVHKIAICNEFGGAIVSTSANKEGGKTPLEAEGIQKIFPEVKVMEGTLGGLNKPSTIEDLITGEVIRG